MAPSKKRGRKPAAAAETNTDANGEELIQESATTPKSNSNSNKRRKSSELGEGNGDASPTESGVQPVIVFAHGAGANSKHEWMVRWKQLLAKTTKAVEVITFDYPYLAGGKKGAPPKGEKLIDPHVAQVVKAMKKHPGHPVVLVGKSMGSRVGCMVAGQEDSNVAAVVCLGYPLKGMNGKIREETLMELKAPVLFVQGTKDSMCPLEKLEQVRRKIPVQNELYTIEGGDHGFKVGAAALKKSFLTHAEMEQKAADAIQAFLKRVLSS
ncbi:unnamed protein product [Calypogeia fissa]